MGALVLWDSLPKTPTETTGEIRVMFLRRSILCPPYEEADEDVSINAVDLFNCIVRGSVPRCKAPPLGVYVHPPLAFSEGVFYLKS